MELRRGKRTALAAPTVPPLSRTERRRNKQAPTGKREGARRRVGSEGQFRRTCGTLARLGWIGRRFHPFAFHKPRQYLASSLNG
jgi:hypothetical protein